MSLHKRKHDFRPSDTDQIRKKQRPENGFASSHEGHSQDSPQLPPISREYEKAVFVHASLAAPSSSNPQSVNYERLEFLGDAQIEHIASIVIFERFQTSTPGKMSSIREELVRNETLSKFSRLYGLDKRLKIALGESQPRDWVKIHADLFEAYVAAVILSDVDPHYGFDTATRWLTKLWEPKLREFGLKITPPKDLLSKEQLGRSLLVKGARLLYKDEQPPIFFKSKGKQKYFIGVYYTGLGYEDQHLGSGEGESKNSAGQEAAKQALRNPLLDEIKVKRAAHLEEKERREIEQEDKLKEEEERKRVERAAKHAEIEKKRMSRPKEER